jgi:hypothetical protein
MRTISFAQATLEAMEEEMTRDGSVFVMGEDIARQGGIFGQFKGLPDKFGKERVIDTPISETAIVGAAIGRRLRECGRWRTCTSRTSWESASTKSSTRWRKSTTCSGDRKASRWSFGRRTE